MPKYGRRDFTWKQSIGPGLGLGFRDEIFPPEWPDPFVSKDAESLSLGAKYEF